MKAQKILCPTDFSHFTDAALSYATSLAAESGAKLYIIYVNDLLSTSVAMGEPAFVDTALWLDTSRQEAHRQLDEVKPTLSSINFERRYLEGDPVREIVAFAAREHADLIVVGSHGRTGLVRLVMGSVAEGIARLASCPVLIVKQPASEAGVLQPGSVMNTPSTQSSTSSSASSAG